MSDEPETVDIETETPHVHHRTGREWLDISLALSAFFISLVSIWIALQHGKVMERLVEQNERLVQANSLPHLQLLSGNVGPNGEDRISFWVSNEGVGPAQIQFSDVRFDGRPVTSLVDFMRDCCDAPPTGAITSSLGWTMIRPGETIRYFDFPVTPANRIVAERLDKVRQAGRISTRVCYCSVFGECWTRGSRDPKPQKVEACPAPPSGPKEEEESSPDPARKG